MSQTFALILSAFLWTIPATKNKPTVQTLSYVVMYMYRGTGYFGHTTGQPAKRFPDHEKYVPIVLATCKLPRSALPSNKYALSRWAKTQ